MWNQLLEDMEERSMKVKKTELKREQKNKKITNMKL